MRIGFICVALFIASLGVAGCKHPPPIPTGGVTVNPDDGTVYYQSDGETKLRSCEIGKSCVEGSDLGMKVLDMAYVAGNLWIVDGERMKTCSIAGACTTMNTIIQKPIGVEATSDGVIYVIGTKGHIAKCDASGGCKELH